MVTANAIGDELVDRPVRFIDQTGIKQAQDFAAIMRRLALADDVEFLVIPSEMCAVWPLDAGPRDADDFVILAIILDDAARTRAGKIRIAVVDAICGQTGLVSRIGILLITVQSLVLMRTIALSTDSLSRPAVR